MNNGNDNAVVKMNSMNTNELSSSATSKQLLCKYKVKTKPMFGKQKTSMIMVKQQKKLSGNKSSSMSLTSNNKHFSSKFFVKQRKKSIESDMSPNHMNSSSFKSLAIFKRRKQQQQTLKFENKIPFQDSSIQESKRPSEIRSDELSGKNLEKLQQSLDENEKSQRRVSEVMQQQNSNYDDDENRKNIENIDGRMTLSLLITSVLIVVAAIFLIRMAIFLY